MKRILLFILSFFFIFCPLSANQYKRDYYSRFINITEEDGLTSNKVIRLFQDSEGVMWIGTLNGLSRYDGHHFTTYRTILNDTTSISDNTISAILEDNHGRLLVGTYNGLNVFDKITGKFSRVKEGRINAMTKTSDGTIWILWNRGKLTNFLPSDGKNMMGTLDFVSPEGDYYYYDMKETDNGQLFCSGRAISFFDIYLKDSLRVSNIDIPYDIIEEVSCFAEISPGTFFIGSYTASSFFMKDSIGFSPEMTSIPISPTCAIYDTHNVLWIGGKGGLIKSDTSLANMVLYQNNRMDMESLASNGVNCLYEDRNGDVWIGTDSGLSIYSRYKNSILHFRKTYTLENDISSDKITALLQDRDSLLWVGTADDGVDTINLSTGRIGNLKYSLIDVPLDEVTAKREKYTLKQYRLHKVRGPINENHISALYEDSRGDIYVGLWSHTGFNIYDKKRKEFKRYALWGIPLGNDYLFNQWLNQNPWGSNWYSGFLEDSKGRFWCATWEGLGMNLFDRNRGEFIGEDYINYSPFRLELVSYNYLIPDTESKRLFCIGNANNICYYDFNSTSFCRFVPLPPDNLVNRKIFTDVYLDHPDFFFLDTKGWIIPLNFSDGENIYYINNLSSLIALNLSYFTTNEVLKYDFKGLRCCLGKSFDGNSFYFLLQNDIIRIDVKSGKVYSLSQSTPDTKKLLSRINRSFNIHYNIKETSSGDIFFGGFGTGLYMLPAHTDSLVELNQMSGLDIYCIVSDEDENFYLGCEDGLRYMDKNTFGVNKITDAQIVLSVLLEKDHIYLGTVNGLMKISRTGEVLNHFSADDNNQYSLASGNINAVARYDDSLLFVSSSYFIQRFNEKTGEFFTINNINDNRLAHRLASCIMENSRGEIWYGTTDNGLSIIDINTNIIKNHSHFNWDSSSLPDPYVCDIFESSDGTMWVGTMKGLCQYIPDDDNFRRIEYFDNKRICKIEEDEKSRLWISTTEGLFCFNPTTDYTVFCDKNLGFQGNEYSNASYKMLDGRLAFGGDNGFNIFNPVQVIDSMPASSSVVFSSFKINDKLTFSSVSGEMNLKHRENTFSFDFSALDYCFGHRISYRYRLKGFDKEWNYTKAPLLNVRYTNVSGGKHVFEIEASNPVGEWKSNPTQLIFNIRPPFYFTWWFNLLLLAFIVGIVIFIIKFRERSLKKEKIKLEETIAARTAEIGEKAAELKKEVETKNRFLSIISHDLKNPLNALEITSQQLLESYDSMGEDDKKSAISAIRNTSETTLEMLNSLLIWTLSQMEMLTPDYSDIDLKKTCDVVCEFLSLPSEKKNVKILNNIPDGLMVHTDSNMLSTILRNLLGNAIKYSYSGSEILIYAHKAGEKVEIFVEDNGMGMEQSTVAKLFRIESKVRKIGTQGEKGAGLGLIIVGEFIQRMKETIRVKSDFGKGSIFIFTLTVSDSANL